MKINNIKGIRELFSFSVKIGAGDGISSDEHITRDPYPTSMQ